MSFADFKKRSKTNFGALAAKVEELDKGGKFQKDPRFWSPTPDKVGNAMALIRFLALKDDTKLPFVRVFSHGFKTPSGRWFIENCPTTIGQDCPVCAANTLLYESGDEKNKKIASSRKRKLRYISNILVLQDKAKPENDGKLMLFSYGAQIFNVLKRVMKPEFEDEVGFDPFNYWEGANFKLKQRKNDGDFPNFESSSFEARAPLFDGNDKKLEALWNQLYDIDEFVAEKQFKSYDEIKAKFDKAIGGVSRSRDEEEEEETVVEKKIGKKNEGRKAPWEDDEDTAPKGKKPSVEDDDEDIESAVDYVKNLANRE